MHGMAIHRLSNEKRMKDAFAANLLSKSPDWREYTKQVEELAVHYSKLRKEEAGSSSKASKS